MKWWTGGAEQKRFLIFNGNHGAMAWLIHFELPLNRLHLRKRKETNQNRTQNSEEVLTVLIFITSTVHNRVVIFRVIF